jgi:hypothetical protein
MKRNLFGVMLALFLICWIAGCATPVPKPVTPVLRDPAIVEEDIKEPSGGEATEPPEAQSPGVTQSPAPPAEETVPATGPVDRTPRRFIWKDRKGSGRSWAPAEE